MSVCNKYNCPNRAVFGSSDDEDSISYVCTKCNDLYYFSETRSNRVKSRLKYSSYVIAIVGIIFILILIGQQQDAHSNSTANSNIKNQDPIQMTERFFSLINEEKMQEAYQLTDNRMWSPYSRFSDLWEMNSEIELLDHKVKQYPSRFDSDTIYEITYRSVKKPDDIAKREIYDFHYKKYIDGWRIIRMIFARPEHFYAPGLELTEFEKSSSASQTLRTFFRFLDKGDYNQAHLLTYNSSWGNYEKFASTDKGWGGIKSINVHKIERLDIISDYGEEVFYCRYYSYDPANESDVHEYLFHLKRINGEWKIVKATNPPDNIEM